jgi:hypothetical protein
MKKLLTLSLVGLAFSLVVNAGIAHARPGRGLGPSVSQAAKAGVHGQQLQAQIQAMNQARGVGQGQNGGGQGQGGQGQGGQGQGQGGQGQGQGGAGRGKGKPAGVGGGQGGQRGGGQAGGGQGKGGGKGRR